MMTTIPLLSKRKKRDSAKKKIRAVQQKMPSIEKTMAPMPMSLLLLIGIRQHCWDDVGDDDVDFDEYEKARREA